MDLLEWLERYWLQDKPALKYLNWCWLDGERVCLNGLKLHYREVES